MKNVDFARYFEIEGNTMYDLENKPSTLEIEYWINQGYAKFIKTRYSGVNYKQLAFEQDQKRVEDLKKLIKVITSVPTRNGNTNTYTIPYPSDMYIALGENALIKSGTNDEVLVDVFECTIENHTSKVTNSLTDVNYRSGYARPARLSLADGVELTTDGNYDITKYVLYYIKTPVKIDILNKPLEEFNEVSEISQLEIVKLAVQMYIENKANPRYQTITEEISKME